MRLSCPNMSDSFELELSASLNNELSATVKLWAEFNQQGLRVPDRRGRSAHGGGTRVKYQRPSDAPQVSDASSSEPASAHHEDLRSWTVVTVEAP